MEELINKENMFLEPILSFSLENFIKEVNLNASNHAKFSSTDELLWKTWKEAEKLGALNYSVNDVLTKILEGKYNVVAQLNPARAQKRRKPFPFNKVVEAVNPNSFNFCKINHNEVLFNIKINLSSSQSVTGSLIVNSAPICSSHSLLLPSPLSCSPQVLNEEGLLLAVSFVMLSALRSLRLGFNSMCAYASVNHYHFHAYYLEEFVYVETAKCEEVKAPCYTFVDHYAPGFVFEVTPENICLRIREVMKLIDYLMTSNIPHNVFITRGASVVRSAENIDDSPSTYDVVRLCVWARETTVGAKDVNIFAPALCELAGHVPIYNESEWETLSEDFISKEVNEICSNVYNSIIHRVKEIYC